MFVRAAAFFLFLHCLFSCQHAPPPPQPPTEWIVIGNDLGFRNEFVDMVNVVRLRDSSLSVYSVAYPDVVLTFPIRDGKVIGGPEQHWPLRTVGPDTLLLLDTVNQNRYHLLRLRPYDPELDLATFFTQRRFRQERGGGETIINFQGDGRNMPNCYVSHGFSVYDSLPRPHRLQDGFWRIDERFAQPLLLYTRGQGEHYVNVIDTITPAGEITGRLLVNSQPHLREMELNLTPVAEQYGHSLLAGLLDSLRQDEQQVTPLLNPAQDPWRRISSRGKELRESLSIPDFELEDLRLYLKDNAYEIVTSTQTISSGSFALHPDYPYLVLDGACANDAYWPLSTAGRDTLRITVPIRVQLTDQELKPYPVGETPPGRVAYSENAVVFSIPATVAGK